MYNKEDVIKSLGNYNTIDKYLSDNSIEYFKNSLDEKLQDELYRKSEYAKSCLFSHLKKTEHTYDRSHVIDMITKLREKGIILSGKTSRKTFVHKDQIFIIMGGKLSALGSKNRYYQRITPKNYDNKEGLDIIWVLGSWRTALIIDNEKWENIINQEERFLYYDKTGNPKGIDLSFKINDYSLEIASPHGDHKNIHADEVLNRWDLINLENITNDFPKIDLKSAKKVLSDASELINILDIIRE